MKQRKNGQSGGLLQVAAGGLPRLQWKYAGGAFAIAAAIMLFILWFQYEEALTAWKRELEPLPFFTVLALAGTVGIPTTPFYVLAGMIFGPSVAMIGVGLAILGYLTLSYSLARGPLRRWSEPIRIGVERRTQYGWLRRPAVRVAILRMMPGVPGALKNYGAASMGTNLPVYLLVSWPLCFATAAALILLGDAFMTRRPVEALPAVLMLVLIAVVAYLLRRSGVLRRRKSIRAASSRAKRETACRQIFS